MVGAQESGKDSKAVRLIESFPSSLSALVASKDMKGAFFLTRRFFFSRQLSQSGGIYLETLILLVAAFVSVISKTDLRQDSSPIQNGNDKPPIYLPSAEYVRLITFGFDHFGSDILWFETINYFGKQSGSQKDYRWLYQMCDLVTELDHSKHFAFEFCGTLLSWEAKHPEQSNAILTKAIQFHPTNWRYRYLRGFNYWYFLEDKKLAQSDLEIASHLDRTPAFVASLASRLIGDQDSVETAITFLKTLLENTEEENARRTLRNKLRRAYLSQRLESLEHARATFEQVHQRKLTDLNELVTNGLIPRIPREPFGGKFYLDPESGKVATSSKRKGLTFGGLSAKTGIAKEEFKREQ